MKEPNQVNLNTDLEKISKTMLDDVRSNKLKEEALSVPIAQLATLGAGVAALIPAFRTVTATMSVDTTGLYRIANAEEGDTLKKAKNGNFWAALVNKKKKSKMVQLQETDSLSAVNTVKMPIDPATVLMAAALFSIEKQLGSMQEMEQQILSFLETEKEAEIEADIEMLTDMIAKYKHNWDNEHYVASNHKMVLDIQRTARKNINSYQKNVNEILDSKQAIIVRTQVSAKQSDLVKKFQYYRLSLFAFSMASLLEILLSGNFAEEYITDVENEIEDLSMEYRELYGRCSIFLETMSNIAVENNVLKGIGAAGEAVGKFIGSIPVVKEGPVDELLQERGGKLKNSAENMNKKVVMSFATMSNPNTGVFIEEMQALIRIYHRTDAIYFDRERIYLAA